MRYLGYIGRWVIGFSFFFLIAAVVLLGLPFFSAKKLYILVQQICRAALRCVGLRIKVTGLERFDHRGTYLIIANHESLLDAFICPAYIPMFFTTLELAEHFSWPVWGTLIRKWGHIPISRGGVKAAIQSLQKASTVLQTGTTVLIFPEGGRTVTGEMQPFKKGAFILARNARATILPVAINGLYRAKTRGDWRFHSANVALTFGCPLPFSQYANWDIEQLRDWAWQTINALKKEVNVGKM